jgi:hypothetical protein
MTLLCNASGILKIFEFKNEIYFTAYYDGNRHILKYDGTFIKQVSGFSPLSNSEDVMDFKKGYTPQKAYMIIVSSSNTYMVVEFDGTKFTVIKNNYDVKKFGCIADNYYLYNTTTQKVDAYSSYLPDEELTNPKIFDGKIYGTCTESPEYKGYTYNGLPIPVGSILKNISDSNKKYIKTFGDVHSFDEIPLNPDSAWNWISGTEGWNLLQSL